MASQPNPRNSRPYEGLINHWFPLIRAAIKPLFLRGVHWGGRLTSHDSLLPHSFLLSPSGPVAKEYKASSGNGGKSL